MPKNKQSTITSTFLFRALLKLLPTPSGCFMTRLLYLAQCALSLNTDYADFTLLFTDDSKS